VFQPIKTECRREARFKEWIKRNSKNKKGKKKKKGEKKKKKKKN